MVWAQFLTHFVEQIIHNIQVLDKLCECFTMPVTMNTCPLLVAIHIVLIFLIHPSMKHLYPSKLLYAFNSSFVYLLGVVTIKNTYKCLDTPRQAIHDWGGVMFHQGL